MVTTNRVNAGGYNGIYHRIMHIFASDDIDRMTVTVRLVNVAIAAAAVLALLLLLDGRSRRLFAWGGIVLAMPPIPMLVASVNPESWALTGITTVMAALVGAYIADAKWRRWALVALSFLGAFLASVARPDTAAFTVVAAVAVGLLFITQIKKVWPVMVASLGIICVGVWGFLSSQENSAITSGMGTVVSNTQVRGLQLLVRNLVYFPTWLSAGWHTAYDVAMPDPTAYLLFACTAAMAAFALARSGMSLGKVISILLVGGVLVGAPMAVLQAEGSTLWAPGNGGVQVRYELPALIMLIFVVLVPLVGKSTRILSLRSTVLLWLAISLCSIVNLHVWIRRWVTGLDYSGVNLDLGVGWWRSWMPSPMATWMIGSVGFTVAAAAIVFVWWSPMGARRALAASYEDGQSQPDGN